MADDGKGSSVYIPTFLIGKKDGDVIKEEIHQKREPKKNRYGKRQSLYQSIIIQANLRLGNKDKDKLHLDVWYGSIYEFALSDVNLRDYSDMSELFKNDVIFQPRIMTKSCESCNEENKKARCINNGKYCPIAPDMPSFARDPNFLREHNLSPYEIILENLREQCVH